MNTVWQAGVARIDISPPPEIDLGGYAAREPGNLGVHDPVFVHTLFLAAGRECAILVVCDVLGFHKDDADVIRRLIAEQHNVPFDNIFLIATHSHSAPATLPGNGLGTVNPGYFRWLKNKILQSVYRAKQSVQSVEIGFTTTESDIGINRRGKIPEGSIDPVPDPTGPVDRQLSVIHIKKRNSGQPWIVLFSFGCHPTVLGPDNRRVSSDFPGAARTYLQNQLGGDCVALFLNGAAGNVNPVERGDFSTAMKLGNRLGEQVLKALSTTAETLPARIRTRSETLIWPFAEIPSLDECRHWEEHYRRLVDTAQHSADRRIFAAAWQWARQLYSMVKKGEVMSHIHAPFQVMVLGDVAVFGVPAEVFAQTALAIKDKVQQPAMVLGYTSGNFGYLPPGDEIPKGGYEIKEAHKYYNYPSHFSPEAEEKVRQTATSLLKALTL